MTDTKSTMDTKSARSPRGIRQQGPPIGGQAPGTYLSGVRPVGEPVRRVLLLRLFVLALAAVFCVLAKADLRAQRAHLIFVDQSVSAHSDTAYRYAREQVFGALNARASGGDEVRVYGVHARTREVPPVRQVRVASAEPRPEELAGLGGRSQRARREEAARAFKAGNFGAVKAAHAATQVSPGGELAAWTDLHGVFELAADRQREGAAEVYLEVWSDGVHSVPGRDYAAEPIRGKAAATAAGRADAAALHERYDLSGFRAGGAYLTLYFPRSGGRGDARAEMRYYWRALGEALGLGGVRFRE